MLRNIGIGVALLSFIFISTACTSSTLTVDQEPTSPPASEPNPVVNPQPRPSGAIEATWIQVDLDVGNQTVSVPVDELEDNWNIHFKLETTSGDIDFMAYIFKGKAYVRANVCPPCHSVGFALDEDNRILICDRCATIFDAETGSGIEGACVDYPKAAVPYEIINGRIVISITDLTAAYQETIAPG